MNNDLKKLKLLFEQNYNNIDYIKNELKRLYELGEIKNYEYLLDLLDPKNRKDARIPEPVSNVPTKTFQLHLQNCLLTNVNQIAFKITPFFLMSNKNRGMNHPYRRYNGGVWADLNFYTEYILPSCYLTFYEGDDYVRSMERDRIINQMVPDGIFSKYRLVSAMLELRYVGPIDEACGVIGGGFSFSNDDHILCYGRTSPNSSINVRTEYPVNNYESAQDYMFVDNIRQMAYYQEKNPLEGLKMYYFPLDNSYLEFYNLVDFSDVNWDGLSSGFYPVMKINQTNYKPNFSWYIYMQYLPKNIKCFLLDIYLNYECILETKMYKYIPLINNKENKKSTIKKLNYEYLLDLLDPKNRINVRIPSRISLPTATFQLKWSTIVTTRSSGNRLIRIFPYFLMESIPDYEIPFTYKVGTTSINEAMLVDYILPSSNYIYKNNLQFTDETYINQIIDPNIYSKYRLVSGMVELKYTGSLDNVKGVIGGGISFEHIRDDISCYGTGKIGRSWLSTLYLSNNNGTIESESNNINNVRKMAYHQEKNPLEGLKMYYFPVDNSYFEFIKLPSYEAVKWDGIIREGKSPVFLLDPNVYKPGFSWFIYIEGGESNAREYVLDLYLNFECIPTEEMNKYIPVDYNKGIITDEEMKKVLEEVHKNSIK